MSTFSGCSELNVTSKTVKYRCFHLCATFDLHVCAMYVCKREPLLEESFPQYRPCDLAGVQLSLSHRAAGCWLMQPATLVLNINCVGSVPFDTRTMNSE